MCSPLSRRRLSLTGVLLFAIVTTAYASGATFAITGQGISLGEAMTAEEGGKELLRFHGKAIVGTPFTLTAQGIVLPRGGNPQPGEPDSGKWNVPVNQFKKSTITGPTDSTKIAIRLEPNAAGVARVRFEGKILGYDRTFEVVIDVMAK